MVDSEKPCTSDLDIDELIDEESCIPPFCIKDGKTFIKRKKGMMYIFGDFTLKIVGETTLGPGYWVLSCGARVRGLIEERRIVIPVSAFDSKSKFLERTRSAFGGGSFNLNDVSSSDLDSYHTYLKDKYYGEGPVREFLPVLSIGYQSDNYWCFSSEVHMHNKRRLNIEDHQYLFVDQELKPFEVEIEETLLNNLPNLLNVCKRFILASKNFGVNEVPFKLATAFVLARLLRVDDKESWNESSIGMLHSSYDERNVGKSLTLDLLAKGIGVPSRAHCLMLAGGDQNQSGTSVPVIRDILSKTNLVVFLDDPILTSNLGELLLQIQSGLSMGSQKSGVMNPQGTLLMTSNEALSQRTEGRVIVIEYTRGEEVFSADDERKLREGIKSIVAQNKGVLLAWTVKFKEVWDKFSKDSCDIIYAVLSRLRPELQPRWHKGMAAVLFSYTLFHRSVNSKSHLADVIVKVVKQNEPPKPQDDSVLTRLEKSLLSKVKKDTTNVLRWVNPTVKVSVDGKFVQAMGIRSSALENFSQVSMKEVAEKTRKHTDNKSSTALAFAENESCSIENVKKRSPGFSKMAKGWKLPTNFFSTSTVNVIRERCGLELIDEGSKYDSDHDEAESETFEDDCVQLKPDEITAMEHIEQELKEACQTFESQQTFNPPVEELEKSSKEVLQAMSPSTSKYWMSLTPRRKRVFKKGIEAGVKIVTKKAYKENVEAEESTPLTNAGNIEAEESTPPTNAGNIEAEESTPPTNAGPKRTLFPTGTIEAMARADSTKESKEENEEGNEEEEEVEVCFACDQTSPNKANWSGLWVLCEQCKNWYHKECTKLRRKPRKNERWICDTCMTENTNSKQL